MRGQHKPLVNFLTSRLHNILVNETDDYEIDLQAGDIEIVGEDPMIISWGAFLQLGQQELEEYEQFRYPEIFRPFAFKSIWQKLRSLDTPPGLNIRRLLEREDDPEWSFKTFVKRAGCQASYNIEQDILYLGSDNKALIEKAHRHLDSLFEYRVSAFMEITLRGYQLTKSALKKRSPPSLRHLILPPATSLDWRISLRPISNFAVATSTIIRTNAVTAKHDYRNLYTNGVITTYVFTERADGVRGPPVATNTNHVQPRKTFVDFAGYIYPPKQPADRQRSRVRVSERTLPRSLPQNTTAIVADWVRETGESHGQYDQGFQSAVSQAFDSCILDSAAHQPTEVGSSIEPDYHQRARNANSRDLLDDEGPCLSQVQSVCFQGSGAGSSRQVAPQRSRAQRDEPSARDGTSTQGTGQTINSSSLDFARPNPMPYLNSALADLVGLTIPITKEVQTSNELPEYLAPPKAPDHSTLVACLQPSRKACEIQLGSWDSGQTTRQANVSDLLGMGDEDAPQSLMAPMVPTSGLQPSSRGHSPPREYHRTMGQKVPRRKRTGEQRGKDTKERASPSPSPPPSARRRSKIPVRSGTPAPRSQGSPRPAAQKGSATGGEKALAPTQSVGVWNSQLRGGWNKGIGGQQFKEVTLPPVLRSSIEERLYFEQALEDCLIDMASRSRILAGKVSMEIVFGRIVLENIDEDVINLGGVDSFEPNYEPLRFLQELAIFDETNLRLHNTLSLDGNDANMLKNIPWISDPKNKWVLQDTEVFYDLNCRDVSTNCCFTVQINASTFAYSFESQRYGLADVAFIHCPDRSWDLNACLRVTDTVYFEEHYGEFASSVTESLAVS